MSITKEQRDRLREMHAATTPGPWLSYVDGKYIYNAEYGGFINNWNQDANAVADMHFIAAAHKQIPELLDEIDRLENELDEIHKEQA
ncbi:hypothetical protein [Dermabacter vaginalis]|uniref:Peptidase S74 domain-containing protein n=1 Tax=Dermabacter vaginalis TaxID=1630135 RepID=A0ABX6A368_9MICO|nr:hypothetical protein [Dermabacter vaginalis]QEU11629.1 hypothetical protein FOB48_04525 [Dermabacter vaginalis]